MRNGDPKRVGALYFISSDTQQAVKIGFAENVYMRLKSLQTGNPDELKLLAYVPCFAEAEVLLHRALKHKRIRLEWYPDDAELETLIYELQDDMFDAAMEVFDPAEGISFDEASSLLNAAYTATPLPTSLIVQRVRECCLALTQA
jgi:hypothetical protein